MPRTILSLFALAVYVIIQYALALWSAELFKNYAVYFRSVLPVWGLALANVHFALTTLGLFWVVNGGQDRDVAVAVIYAGVGLLLVLSVPVITSMPDLGLMRILRNPAFLSAGSSGLPLAGAFIMLIGLYPFIRRQPQ